jgi:hypothetical protein
LQLHSKVPGKKASLLNAVKPAAACLRLRHHSSRENSGTWESAR